MANYKNRFNLPEPSDENMCAYNLMQKLSENNIRWVKLIVNDEEFDKLIDG